MKTQIIAMLLVSMFVLTCVSAYNIKSSREKINLNAVGWQSAVIDGLVLVEQSGTISHLEGSLITDGYGTGKINVYYEGINELEDTQFVKSAIPLKHVYAIEDGYGFEGTAVKFQYIDEHGTLRERPYVEMVGTYNTVSGEIHIEFIHEWHMETTEATFINQ